MAVTGTATVATDTALNFLRVVYWVFLRSARETVPSAAAVVCVFFTQAMALAWSRGYTWICVARMRTRASVR